jgi:PhzF family phenazine biosynthesis protein
MKLPIYHINAFTGEGLSGNPAAVVPLEAWPDVALMQSIAEQNNLSETAFVAPEAGQWRLRWFTPQVEVPLCGHATLAAAYVLWEHQGVAGDELHFLTQSGQLTARREEDRVAVELPESPLSAVVDEVAEAVWGALRWRGEAVLRANYLMAVLESAGAVEALEPDMDALRRLPAAGVIATAAGTETDFVSRFFAPALGVPEDPVTGSAHCALVPYWAERLGRPELRARQLSRRGGELFCVLEAGRVIVGGRARTYLAGQIEV